MDPAQSPPSLVLRAWLTEPGSELRVRIMVAPSVQGDASGLTRVVTNRAQVHEVVESWLASLYPE